MTIYINRRSRVRHRDSQCHAIASAREQLDRQQFDARVLTLLHDPVEHSPLADFVRDFTVPCVRCWPGADHVWSHRPAGF